MECFPISCRVHAASSAPAWGVSCPVPGAALVPRPGPHSLTTVSLFGAQGDCSLSRCPLLCEGQSAPPLAGVQRGPPVIPLRRSGRPLQTAVLLRCLRRRHSTRAPGFRVELWPAPRPLPRRTETPHGTQIRLCRFPPGQTVSVCVVFLAGPRGELCLRISYQALTEPLDYTPAILAG
ncbi:hypothetical protein NDU88_003657 [Pleurodeles waltl]|uniref:Uncharacterized protein n=1 Tax=Pleurodeles waltl TaxID=8319 RepID=A0AAV7MT33_PLEWA|nr:hypothetical protein NDU88_003657 [Pleurodeles waltl]